MAQFHFVEDYERYVSSLIASHPIDEAMSLAVGGSYEETGAIEAAILKAYNVNSSSSIVDLGCGSGRLAHALGKAFPYLRYTGLDVVQALLDYAKTRCPPQFRFILNRQLKLPLEDSSADVFTSFSVFTHLLHTETYLYLEDAFRVLRPGGQVIMSFLEFAGPPHWTVFEQTLEAQRNSEAPHLNTFIERNAIGTWCDHIGFKVVEFANGWESVRSTPPLGQSIAVLQKP